MVRPFTIRYAGTNYEIVWNDMELADRGVAGEARIARAEIGIAPYLCHDLQAKTLIHECIHLRLLHVGIREHNEQEIDMHAHGEYHLMRDNPDLVKWIMSDAQSKKNKAVRNASLR